jgi:hypothetical protein
VDTFAAPHNKRFGRFWTDAEKHKWDITTWSNPPYEDDYFFLLYRKIREFKSLGMACVPEWTDAPWWPLLMSITVDSFTVPHDVFLFQNSEGTPLPQRKWRTRILLLDGKGPRPGEVAGRLSKYWGEGSENCNQRILKALANPAVAQLADPELMSLEQGSEVIEQELSLLSFSPISVEACDDTILLAKSTKSAKGRSEIRGYKTKQPEFVQAAAKELASWRECAAYERAVPPPGQHIMGSRMIYTTKVYADGTTGPKCRVVVQGFTDAEKGHLDKYAPTGAKTSFRMVNSLMSTFGFRPRSLDIKTAFLQGRDLDRVVFIRPPPEANEDAGVCWRLIKPAYGLIDAAAKWAGRVKDVLTGLGACQSVIDPAVYYWIKGGTTYGMMVTHVDDFYWGGGV